MMSSAIYSSRLLQAVVSRGCGRCNGKQ